MVHRIRAIVVAFIMLCASGGPAGATDLGGLAFANSGPARAQEPFLRGLFLLHNFEYADAAAAFREAQAAAPGFALAYWGEALTYNHPVWFEQDAVKARAALQRLAPGASERVAKAPTAREKGLMEAVESLYGDGSKDERDDRYAARMAQLHADFASDVDITAFYALSLLGTAHHGRDIPTYMRSAALLEEVFPQHADHPGVLHYLIHSYDDPAHAPLGMRPARLYGRFANDAPHAMHMTSHIFMALGRWDETIASNVEAMKAVNARRARAGRPPAACFHYEEWMHYAQLQKRDAAGADATVERCRAVVAALRPDDASLPRATASYAGMIARTQIERGRWTGFAVTPAADADVRFTAAYAEALLKRMSGEPAPDAAGRMKSALAELRAQPHVDGQPERNYLAEEIMVRQIDALDLMAQGKPDAAVAALRRAADDELRMPVEFGPPVVLKPTAELLGDLLLRTGRPRDARAAYDTALRAYPGRTISVEGLRRSDALAVRAGR